ncbi:MAG: dinitrogenase iron-molybdenum cofactor biosynthesis protein [Treponema sp.]|jgi:predicted Fe-Mo cluster-binding NifX family protein|nr:dinitrogenase iron-molybdenum cofactor biosynthesis protein [Treponema sp.]
MSWRVAVTSADGLLINQHFGHAEWFYIIDAEKDGMFKVAEKRAVTPWCRNENMAADKEPGTSGIANDIKDCIAVLTAMIGGPARKKLELAGVAIFEQPDKIDEAIKKLAAYYVKTKQPETQLP